MASGSSDPPIKKTSYTKFLVHCRRGKGLSNSTSAKTVFGGRHPSVKSFIPRNCFSCEARLIEVNQIATPIEVNTVNLALRDNNTRLKNLVTLYKTLQKLDTKSQNNYN